MMGTKMKKEDTMVVLMSPTEENRIVVLILIEVSTFLNILPYYRNVFHLKSLNY